MRLFKDLMRDKEIGNRFVPIIPDEARTFGLDAIFPTAKIYSPHGQEYDAVDRDMLLSYKESTTGQILHEGISEAGSTASLIAAGTAYATHGEPMIPFYIFYSMFGFQRTGDQFWQLADQLGRGFVLGATAGRTTLTGEGLQHADGHSLLLASTNPAAVAYDPAYAYEIAHIVQSGLPRMYGAVRAAPARRGRVLLPHHLQRADHAAGRAGRRRRRGHPARHAPHLARAGRVTAAPGRRCWPPGWRAVGAAGAGAARRGLGRRRRRVVGDLLERAAPRRAGRRRAQLPQPRRGAAHAVRDRPSWPTPTGPVVGVSDYMRAVPDQIAQWVPGDWSSLGADGFGFADTRGAARRFFHIDAESIVVNVLGQLAKRGEVKPDAPRQALEKLPVARRRRGRRRIDRRRFLRRGRRHE